MVRLKFLAPLALAAGFIALDAAAPAAAQPWGPPPPPHHRWGPPPRHRCWIEERRVRVETPWGPRWRMREVRVCR